VDLIRIDVIILLVNPYKWDFREDFMNYEVLLEEAYEKIKPVDSKVSGCGRFEILKVEGHHEGVRTIVSNFGQIVACIRRNPEHLMKFLNKELACSSEVKGDRLILSRKLSSKDINDRIKRYVNRFVLCSKCKKPDTELNNDGSKTFLHCLACGEKYEVHRI